jgi:hypothetical protein
MMTVFVNLILAAWLVLFAALALFPLFLRDHSPQETSVPVEDRVLSVVPSAIAHRLRTHHLPVTADHRPGPDSDHRRAA